MKKIKKFYKPIDKSKVLCYNIKVIRKVMKTEDEHERFKHLLAEWI